MEEFLQVVATLLPYAFWIFVVFFILVAVISLLFFFGVFNMVKREHEDFFGGRRR